MIKEFDLDAPSLPKLDRSEFRYQTRALTSLFERSIEPKIVSGKAWKILVEVVPEIFSTKVRNLLGVLVVQVQGDPGSILLADTDEKKNGMALDWILSGADKLFGELKLERNQLILAEKGCENLISGTKEFG